MELQIGSVLYNDANRAETKTITGKTIGKLSRRYYLTV